MADDTTDKLTSAEERQIREAERRLDSLRREADRAHSEGQLAESVRSTPRVREQLESSTDA